MPAYLKVAPQCPSCDQDFSAQKADDAPPFFTILIVGHIVVPLILVVEKIWAPPLVPSMIFWPIAILALSLWLAPRVKGAIVGLQWSARMHGFGNPEESLYEP